MAAYRKRNADGPNSEDKALDLFAEMMIEKIESIRKDWRKPWFTEGALPWPRNLHGREYNGMNALMLLLHCEKQGYTIPRFCTFDCVRRLNTPGKDGQELPRVSILRGEKSFPVMLTTFTCIHKETKEKIRYEDYKKLSEKEQELYNVFPKMQVFRVFNVAQTNLREARPELWEKLEQEVTRPQIEDGEHLSFAPVDTMIRDDLWICPIRPKHQDQAYYSITKNEIVVPEKEQFKSGEAFYGTLFHEMTHSTGAKDVLDRFKPAAFGVPEYAREELVAELGSALVAQRYGMAKHIKEDSCAYLKGWLDELKESPQFIKTTLLDVKRAASLITQKVDKIARELEQDLGKQERQDNGVAAPERTFYASAGLSPVRRRHEAVRRTERQGRLRRHTDACQRVLRRQRHGRGTYLCYAPAERGRRARGRGQGLRRGVQRQRRGNLRRHAETHGTGGARPHPALRHRPCQRRREGGGQGYGGGRVRRLVAAESAGIRDARRRGTPCQV